MLLLTCETQQLFGAISYYIMLMTSTYCVGICFQQAVVVTRDEMTALLPLLKDAVTSQIRAIDALSECEIGTERFRHQIMYVEEAKDDAMHPLYSLTHR